MRSIWPHHQKTPAISPSNDKIIYFRHCQFSMFNQPLTLASQLGVLVKTKSEHRGWQKSEWPNKQKQICNVPCVFEIIFCLCKQIVAISNQLSICSCMVSRQKALGWHHIVSCGVIVVLLWCYCGVFVCFFVLVCICFHSLLDISLSPCLQLWYLWWTVILYFKKNLAF